MQVTTSMKEAVSAASVRKAIYEFDQIGEHEFLSQYGFGSERLYFLIFKEKKYPSKAIFARAYFHEFGVPLKYEDNIFGRKNYVVPLLTNLGFCVTSLN